MHADNPRRHPQLQKDPAKLAVLIPQHIQRAHRRHHKRRRHHRPAHIVRILQPRPRIHHQSPETRHLVSPIRHHLVRHRMLHPRIRHDNEETREPRSHEHQERRAPMLQLREPLLPKQKQSQKRRLQEEREHSLHRQRLPDNPSRQPRELRPVRAELKFHRDARHHTQQKVHRKDLRPESRRLVIPFVIRPQRLGLQYHDQQRQAHRQLGKQVVERDRECELKPMQGKRVHIVLGGLSPSAYARSIYIPATLVR